LGLWQNERVAYDKKIEAEFEGKENEENIKQAPACNWIEVWRDIALSTAGEYTVAERDKIVFQIEVMEQAMHKQDLKLFKQETIVLMELLESYGK